MRFHINGYFIDVPFENNHRMFVIPHCEKEIHNVHGDETNNIHNWKIFRWKIVEEFDRV